MGASRPRTAVLCIIGNEVLCGRTRDANGHFLASRLAELGIRLRRMVVIPDEMDEIVGCVRYWAPRCDYLFTTGGIGPTHDDITREAIARATGRPLVMHPEAESIVRSYYGESLNDVRLEMARLPEGAELILNPRTGVPGCIVENIFVLPGIPSLIEQMFGAIEAELDSATVFREEVSSLLYEGDYASWLSDLAKAHPEVSIGSYPILDDPGCRTIITVSSHEAEAGEEVIRLVREHVAALEANPGRTAFGRNG